MWLGSVFERRTEENSTQRPFCEAQLQAEVTPTAAVEAPAAARAVTGHTATVAPGV